MEGKFDRKLSYTLIALFQLAGAGSPCELCNMAEEVTGKKFSDELLKETINKVSVELSLEDKIVLTKMFQRFIENLKSMKRKNQTSPEMNPHQK